MQRDKEEISDLIVPIFEQWQQARIEFVVQRNYQELPHSTNNDIDLCIRPDQLTQAEEILVRSTLSSGYQIHNWAELTPQHQIAVFKPSTGQQLHFDLLGDLEWRGILLLSAETILKMKVNRGLFWIPHPASEAGIMLLNRLIFSGKVKEEYKYSIKESFRTYRKETHEILASCFGPKHAEFILVKVDGGEWDKLEENYQRLRGVLVWHQITTQPLRTLRGIAKLTKTLIKRAIHPTGLSVAFVGPDGSGKSTIATLFLKGMGKTFAVDRGLLFHWKPSIFSGKRRGQRMPTTDPHALAPRSSITSLLYFAIHWLEFFIGWAFQISFVKFKNAIAVSERYYLDFLVDPRRYRLALPQWIFRFGYSLLTKPDLIYLLDAPSVVLQNRKQEVPYIETERQREAYLRVVRGLPEGRVIQADQEKEMVTAAIVQDTLEFLRLRALRRMPYKMRKAVEDSRLN